MKTTSIAIALLLSTFSLKIIAQEASDSVESQIEDSTYYRCEAAGKSRTEGWVFTSNENSLLKYAQSGALRDCARKGGLECRITHCFKEIAHSELGNE